jgi:hypothetical protein
MFYLEQKLEKYINKLESISNSNPKYALYLKKFDYYYNLIGGLTPEQISQLPEDLQNSINSLSDNQKKALRPNPRVLQNLRNNRNMTELQKFTQAIRAQLHQSERQPTRQSDRIARPNSQTDSTGALERATLCEKYDKQMVDIVLSKHYKIINEIPLDTNLRQNNITQDASYRRLKEIYKQNGCKSYYKVNRDTICSINNIQQPQ